MSPDPNAMKDPSYRQVCSGITGHVEVLNVELNDPTPEIFEELLKFFFQFHDPTTLNSQGNDKGTQYASYIFTTDDKQKEIAEKVIKNLQALLDNKQIKAFAKDSVTTKVADATEFYVAHAEHQEYLAKNPNGYCNHYVRFHNWPEIS
jgi:peptide-methionine (S)-S-oxide reductase